MKPIARLAAALVLTAAPGFVWAQSNDHHPGSAPGAHPAPSTAPAPSPSPVPSPSPAPSQSSQSCGPMMQMMPMMQGATGERMAGCMSSMPEASRAYMGAMMGMHAPMMEAMQVTDPDVAFVKAIVAHHKATIEMARAALQFGKDERARTFAQKIIDSQQAEVDSIQDWLQQHRQ